jgi:acetamidase/formamidase
MTAKRNAGRPAPGEDVKKRFREALERKQAHHGQEADAEVDPSKVHEAHGPAKVQQMFRRKSGG